TPADTAVAHRAVSDQHSRKWCAMTLDATADLDFAWRWERPPVAADVGRHTPSQLLPAQQRQALSRELHDRVAHAIAVGLNCLELSDRYALSGATERANAKRADALRGLRQALAAARDLATQ